MSRIVDAEGEGRCAAAREGEEESLEGEEVGSRRAEETLASHCLSKNISEE